MIGVMSPSAFPPLDDRIRRLIRDRQTKLALDVATLVEPFADLSTDAQPSEGLPRVAAQIREAAAPVEVDRARHVLWSIPEMEGSEEPQALGAWFAFGACVAWIYAADAKCTAGADGASQTLSRALDLLDYADEKLGDTSLAEDLSAAASDMIDSDASLPTDLQLAVERAIHRLSQLTS